ncbi:MAG: hypothetical protein IPJ24_17915 [bacterium]|nr:hypothetical protein [bacterium]
MRILVRALFAIAMLTAFVPVATADIHVVEIANAQPGYIYVPDLGAVLSGISEVTIRAVGVGGRGFYECVAPATGGWYDFDFEICLGYGCIEFPTVHEEPYDVTQTAVLAEGSWQACEGVTICPLYLLLEPRGFVNHDWRRYCSPAQSDVPLVSRLVITITADSVVATESASWGAIKAMYRN